MTDVKSYSLWNYTDLEKLVDDLHEIIEEENINSQDIIDFKYTSTFVKDFDFEEDKNYTGLVYSAVLLYSSED